MQNSLPASANDAIRLSLQIAAHYARALVLSRVGQLADATREFERAVALRRAITFYGGSRKRPSVE